MKLYYIKFSGAAWDIPAENPKDAWESIQKILDCYCTPNVLEIGRDCDEFGYVIDKKTLDNDNKL